LILKPPRTVQDYIRYVTPSDPALLLDMVTRTTACSSILVFLTAFADYGADTQDTSAVDLLFLRSKRLSVLIAVSLWLLFSRFFFPLYNLRETLPNTSFLFFQFLLYPRVSVRIRRPFFLHLSPCAALSLFTLKSASRA